VIFLPKTSAVDVRQPPGHRQDRDVAAVLRADRGDMRVIFVFDFTRTSA
jgi:hypothetical protein